MYDISLLVSLLKKTEDELRDYIHNELLKYYSKEKIVITKDYTIAEGDMKVALASHTDIVGQIPPTHILYDEEYILRAPDDRGRCLGGDDRCGVYIMLKMLEKGYRPTLLFNTAEETGCQGSSQMAKDYQEIGCYYILQLDRQGAKDDSNVVFYQNDNQEWIEYVKKFQPNVQYGSCSDISVLCPAFGISGANLSVGYSKQHTTSEYIYIPELNHSIEIVENMLKDAKNLSKPFPYVEKTYKYSSYSSKSNYRGSNTWDDYEDYDSWYNKTYGSGYSYGNNTNTAKSSTKKDFEILKECKILKGDELVSIVDYLNEFYETTSDAVEDGLLI